MCICIYIGDDNMNDIGLFGFLSSIHGVGDHLIFNILSALNLIKIEINQEALLNLNESIIHSMIQDKTDQSKFRNWLNAYKQQQDVAAKDKLQQIHKCVQLLPSLEFGLHINIKFSDVCDFEENVGYQMFSCYGFRIFHGWAIDTKDEALYNLIGSRSYDEITDFLISEPKTNATMMEKQQLESDKRTIRQFLAEVNLYIYFLYKFYLKIYINIYSECIGINSSCIGSIICID